MNLTTDNSISEIVNAIADLPYPTRPVKPTTVGVKTAADHRLYANLLEEYEREEEAYKAKLAECNAAQNKLQDLYVEKLFSESSLTRPVFDAVYSKAYDDAHSGGYFEVAGKFEELEAFALRIIELNAK